MKKTKLIYGTYSHKEFLEIISIFEDSKADYELYEHVHTHGANKPSHERDRWFFNRIESIVSPDEEYIIRQKRNLMKKRYC